VNHSFAERVEEVKQLSTEEQAGLPQLLEKYLIEALNPQEAGSPV
jgi:hypothetical protein